MSSWLSECVIKRVSEWVSEWWSRGAGELFNIECEIEWVSVWASVRVSEWVNDCLSEWVSDIRLFINLYCTNISCRLTNTKLHFKRLYTLRIVSEFISIFNWDDFITNHHPSYDHIAVKIFNFKMLKWKSVCAHINCQYDKTECTLFSIWVNQHSHLQKKQWSE